MDIARLEKNDYNQSHTGFKLAVLNNWSSIALLCLCTSSMLFTILFASNCSAEEPSVPYMVFDRPQRNVLVLTIGVQFTIFLLAELVITVLEAIRWALASSTNGVPTSTFITLSRATGFAGILLIWAKASTQYRSAGYFRSHRLWGSKRSSIHAD